MSGIRGKDTKPEMIIRKALHAAGYRYRLHVPNLPGKPDLVFPKHRAVVFIHGCFWHGHNCRYFKIPQTHTEFWQEKINSNIQRDQKQLNELRALGWRILVIWECATRKNGIMQIAMPIDYIMNWLMIGNNDSQIDETGIKPLPYSMTE